MGRQILKKQCKIMDNKLNKILANFYLTQTKLIVNGEEEKYSHKTLFDAAKKTATIQVVLNDGTKLNQSDIKNATMFRFN